MNKRIICKKTFLFVLILIIQNIVYSQSALKIDYYGVVSSEIDENMYKMTSDLYYTQLCEIEGFSITDKRSDSILTNAPSLDSLSSQNLSFYAVISKNNENSKWVSTLSIINGKTNSKKTQTKEYDSYYKILMEPKSTLQASLKKLISTNISTQSNTSDPVQNTTGQVASTEKLAGTWGGEETIDKIVILRGGRGFVIFKNGASMNINIDYKSDSEIIITQNSRSNASYFPEIPRQTALTHAVNASPIQWTFSLSGNNLIGKKRTLIPDGESAKEGFLDIVWFKKD